MTDEEKKQLIKDLISENPEISDELLEEQVKMIHFKRMHADDQKELRMYKELLLADGDLHSDAPGRERRFRWTNLNNNFIGAGGQEDASDCSDDEESTEEEAKWKARRLELEKQKKEQLSLDVVVGSQRSKPVASVEAKEKLVDDDDVHISRVLREANKSLKIACPRQSHEAPVRRAVSGGFLSMKNIVLERIADKVKGSC